MPLLNSVSAEQTLSIPFSLFLPSCAASSCPLRPATSSRRRGLSTSRVDGRRPSPQSARSAPPRASCRCSYSRPPVRRPWRKSTWSPASMLDPAVGHGGRAGHHPPTASSLSPHAAVGHSPTRPEATSWPGSCWGSNCPGSMEEDDHSWGWKATLAPPLLAGATRI